MPTGPHVIIAPSVPDIVPATGGMRPVRVTLGGGADGLYGADDGRWRSAELGDRHTSNGNGWNGAGSDRSGKHGCCS